MRKVFYILLFFITSANIYGQKEAYNWYFGRNAGIRFNDNGSVTPLNGGQMVTNEGCSSMSDAYGNLLLYTDGRNVWDRNHLRMPGGTYPEMGLLGDPSSAQSGIIIPKKGNPNIYYVFTVDEPHHQNAAVYPEQFDGFYEETGSLQFIPNADDGFNNGLNYSVVDLSVTGANGSIGDVTTRNVHLHTYDPNDINQAKYKCSEKITAVKNNNDTGFWIVTHFIDTFYAFLVDANGVNETPVTTQIAPTVPVSGYRRNAIGCIKASPEGNYIAIAHQSRGAVTGAAAGNGVVYLYNFDKATGTLSNPVMVMENTNPYGIEFSPEEKKLYVSTQDPMTGTGEVWQYNLLAADINASGIAISNGNTATTLQLGPNGKIYKAVNGEGYLDVINNPEEDGLACEYVSGGVDLPAGSMSVFGLPPFISSLFSAQIIANATCFGAPTQFSIYSNKPFDSVTWNFGDGSTTNQQPEPQHTYTAPGNYNIVATITRNGTSENITKTISITVPPVANTPGNLVICDNDSDGHASFALSENTPAILGSQNPADFTVYYFASQEHATANQNPLNASGYINTTNPQTIYARVISNTNPDCFVTTSFLLHVGTAPIVSALTYSLCDDAADGSDTNSRANFNLTSIAGTLSASGFTATWHSTEADANAQSAELTGNYNTNTTTLYVRLVNNTFTQCAYVLPVNLVVNPLPPNVTTASLTQCDLQANPDGITQFNLTEANRYFIGNSTTMSVSYFATQAQAQAATDTITGAYTNITPYNDSVFARVQNNTTGCFRVLPLALNVSATTYKPVVLSVCDDDDIEDGYREFNLTDAGFEADGNNVSYYTSEGDALMEQNNIGSVYINTIRNFQTVFARVENNNSCLAIARINLQVLSLPNISLEDTATVCLNTNDYIQLTAGITGSQYSYLWSTGATTANIYINEPGTYSVEVTNTTAGCHKTRTITVTGSNVATITGIVVNDLSDNNTVTVVAVPTGNVQTSYLYSMQSPNGPWQEEPFFENVAGGVHTVYVYDVNGCGVTQRQVGVLKIPKFFSPNADGNNDYWRIPGIIGANYRESLIYIYDRYGKLVATLTPNDTGWDGTYNGVPLPGTDYWYVLNLSDGRTLKGHFSLIR